VIPIGEKYFSHGGIWDGRGSTYKICMDCESLRKEVISIQDPYDDNLYFGGLYEFVLDGEDVRIITKLIANQHRRAGQIIAWHLETLVTLCPEPPIKCAALLFDSHPYQGWGHSEIGNRLIAENICQAPFPGGAAQGFVTSEDKFVGCEEALRIALACGQVLPKEHINAGKLFSEDLRYDT